MCRPLLWDAYKLSLVCTAELDQSALAQLTALLLLISPFFFWGTSMVAFKVLALRLSSLPDHCSLMLNYHIWFAP